MRFVISTRATVCTVILTLFGATGCAYTQLATPPGAYEPEPVYETDYVPEAARGAWGQLSVWGYWIETPEFGWVWQPDVVYDWQPYFHGHWTWTSYGWTWVSYEPFGWITYHYGYWHFDPHYGWYWIPDDFWYAGGVTWVYYDDYICWAPIPPPGYHLVDPWYTHTDVMWMVVDVGHFLSPNVGGYKYRRLRPDPRLGSKRVFRNAPERVFIERKTGQKIREVPIKVGKVRSGNREFQRVIFPDGETRTIDRYRPRSDKSRRSRPTPIPEKSSDKRERTIKREKDDGSKSRSKPEARDTRPSKSKDGSEGSKKKKKVG